MSEHVKTPPFLLKIESEIADFNKKNKNFITLEKNIGPCDLPPALDQHFHKLITACLAHLREYPQDSTIRITLKRLNQNRYIFKIEDNGKHQADKKRIEQLLSALDAKYNLSDTGGLSIQIIFWSNPYGESNSLTYINPN